MTLYSFFVCKRKFTSISSKLISIFIKKVNIFNIEFYIKKDVFNLNEIKS
jgi:hypothetical protein